MRLLRVEPLPGNDPEIGRWLWALQETRRRTLGLVDGMPQPILDWEGPDGWENAVGSLLYHLAIVEMSWLFLLILQRPAFPPSVKTDFAHPMEDRGGRLSRVRGIALSEHLARLNRARDILLRTLVGMPPTDWRRSRRPGDGRDYEVTPEWAVFHLVEHEAGHAFQISALKARATRFFASP